MFSKMQRVLGFSDEEIAFASKNGQLLSMEIELTSRCNLHCLYCYTGKSLFREDELEQEEILDAISQAKALGARKIIYVGAGEPLLDVKLRDTVHYVHKLGMDHVLFTNATLINAEIARFLFDNEVVPVVKYSSMKQEPFDRLTGCDGSHASMIRGLNYLRKAGYPDKYHHLGIEAIVTTYTIKEIPTIWRWARNNNILPYVECVTHKGSAVEHNDIFPGKEAIRCLFENLAQIDKDEFGFTWDECPPIAGFFCKRHLYSCTLNSQGFIQPCVGIDIKLGNIRIEKLSSILRNSKVMQELSQIRTTIKGPCKTCDHHDNCYGCRGNAYNMTGNYLASDPTCWRIKDEAFTCSADCKK